MSKDITLMRGYGFPKGSTMDYAGYGNYGRRFRATSSTREPSIFAKIPALDGLGEDFGSEYTFGADMVLPEMDFTDVQPPATAGGTGKALGVAAVAIGLYFLLK